MRGLTLFKNFLNDTRGNTAMLLGLSILPIGIFAGAAIDFNRAESNSISLGTNLDSAVLATARYAMETPDVQVDEVKAFGLNYLTNSFEPDHTKSLDNVNVVFVPNKSVTITAESTIDSTILSLAKIDALTSRKKATASFGAPTGLRAVMVLDNSSSMDGPKMAALQDAAHDFIDDLLIDGVTDSYIGMVPFSHYVNVGTGAENEDWLDVPADATKSWEHCPVDSAASEAVGCTLESSPCTKWSDGVSYSSTCYDWECPSGVETVKSCTMVSKNYEWCGAVVQRQPPLHISDASYDTIPIEGYLSEEGSNWECNTPILPMTNVKTDLTDYIDSLQARGDTYIAPGLMWGYRALSPEAPFTEMAGKDISSGALVLMSDGMNSRSFKFWSDGSDHYGSDKHASNMATLETCKFIKSTGVDIYAIAFQVDDLDTEEMLKECATTYEHYYDADSFADLNNAFTSVADSFREVALTE